MKDIENLATKPNQTKSDSSIRIHFLKILKTKPNRWRYHRFGPFFDQKSVQTEPITLLLGTNHGKKWRLIMRLNPNTYNFVFYLFLSHFSSLLELPTAVEKWRLVMSLNPRTHKFVFIYLLKDIQQWLFKVYVVIGWGIQ